MNTAVFLKNLSWNGGGLAPTTWAGIILAVAALIVCVVSIVRRDAVYATVGTWALLGVVVANSQAGRTSVALAAGVLAGLTLIVAIVVAVRRVPPVPQAAAKAGYASSGD